MAMVQLTWNPVDENPVFTEVPNNAVTSKPIPSQNYFIYVRANIEGSWVQPFVYGERKFTQAGDQYRCTVCGTETLLVRHQFVGRHKMSGNKTDISPSVK